MKSSAAWEIGWALISVLVIYVLASGSRRTVALGALLIVIPFQVIEHRFGSSSVLMAYALAVIMLLKGDFRVRMLPALGLIVVAYLISLTQADRDIMSWHVIFVFNFFSTLVVFLLAYNFALLVESERTIINVLLVTNAMVVVYCLLQLTAGAGERFVPLGIEAFAFNSNRHPGDPRLVGPFDTPGTTATYFTLMTVLCMVELFFAVGRRKRLVLLLIGGNLLGLVATANRGAFLVMFAMIPALMFLFRDELGMRRIVQYLVGGVAVLALASAIAISYTDFGIMYERMDQVTETQDGLPSTRAGTWPKAFERIKQDPWVGEGPLFLTAEHGEMLGILRSKFDPYPHNLYLYLLRTVGLVGLVAVVGFFIRTWFVVHAAWRRETADVYRSAILRFGLLLIPAFLVDQMRLEFNRPSTIDFAQYIMALMGLLVGVADRNLRSPRGAMRAKAALPPQSLQSGAFRHD